MVEIAKSIENSSVEQEKNKDIRLQTLLKADRKRDEMFLTYQRQQAQANRQCFHFLNWKFSYFFLFFLAKISFKK